MIVFFGIVVVKVVFDWVGFNLDDIDFIILVMFMLNNIFFVIVVEI